MDFQITSIRLTKDNANNDRKAIARFDCDVGGLRIRGFALGKIIGPNTLAIWSPTKDGESKLPTVVFTDPALRGAVIDAASAAYRALGGTELDG